MVLISNQRIIFTSLNYVHLLLLIEESGINLFNRQTLNSINFVVELKISTKHVLSQHHFAKPYKCQKISWYIQIVFALSNS